MARLPDFIILGAQRCGTRSLYNWLCQHPQICAATNREVHFFDWNYRELAWYKKHFTALPDKLTGEASPMYLVDRSVPPRVRNTFGARDVKFLVLMRNPVDRAYSQYWHNRRRNTEPLDEFWGALGQEELRLHKNRYAALKEHSYKKRGRYAQQLEHWYTFFPKRQFMLIKSEAMFAEPIGTLMLVLDWLGVDSGQVGKIKPVAKNVAEYPSMDYHDRVALADYFRPHIFPPQLYELCRRASGVPSLLPLYQAARRL